MQNLLDVGLTLALLAIVLFVVNRAVLWTLRRVTIRPMMRLSESTVEVLDDLGSVVYEEPCVATLTKHDGVWRIAGFGESADSSSERADSSQVFNVVKDHAVLPGELGGLLDGLLLFCARRAAMSSPDRPRAAVARPIRGKVELKMTDPEERAWVLRQLRRSKYFEAG
jgi:hypothetical protein